MPTPPPDPSGRQSPETRVPANAPGPPEELPGPGQAQLSSKASTNSHYPAASSSDLNASADQPVARLSPGSDILQMLNDPGVNPNLEAAENTDDSPTVITRGIGDQPPPPVPLNVLATDPPMLAGRRLGNFELIESVGAGGMAAVLKARDTELGRVVALKILPPVAARDPESVTRFKQEARAAALLDHDNVARVYACGEDQGLHFIAFEFVEGINLRQMIERRGTIPAAESVRYMIQVAAGLAHAAERGVVHRDIKPSNILITPDHRAKIVDMGLARQLEMPANGGLTQSGVTLGTFDYISPEQALDPRRADVRSDIYSLGCTFYHALTGRPPVPEGTAAKKLYAHQHTDPLDPREIKPDIPDELVVILAQMMAKSPERRYQTPEELIAHLKGLAERLKLPDASGQDSVVRAVRAERSLHPPQLRLGWVLAVASVVVAVAAFALSTGNRGVGPTPPPWGDDSKQAKIDPVNPAAPGGKSNTGAPTDDGIVRTVEQLAAKIAEPDAEETPRVRKILLGPGTFDLTQLPSPIIFRGKDLELIGSTNQPTVLKVHPTPMSAPTAPPAGAFAAIGSESVSLAWVRFVSVLPPDDESPDTARAAFVAADVGVVSFADCVFAGSDTARADGVGGVRVTRSSVRLRAERCAFSPASFGLWLPDSCRATVFDCGFGPHDAAIRIGEARATAVPVDAPVQDAEISLERSSFLLDSNSAVLANLSGGNGSGVEATAEYCVFAAGSAIDPLSLLPGVPAFVRRPVVVRAHAHPDEVRFTGKRKNAYHNTAVLSVPVDGDTKFYTLEQCKEKQFPIADAHAVLLQHRPWAEADPLAALVKADPWRAFGLNLKDPDVFTDSQVKVIGAQFHDEKNFLLPRRAYPNPGLSWPPELPKSAAVSRGNQLVWYPDLPKDEPPTPNTYADLEDLLKVARPGDEILIRHTGLLHLDRTVELEKLRGSAAEFRVTFKPDRGHTPVLAAPSWNRLDQTLFRLINGRVAFQGVQFLLKPGRPRDGQTVAAVAIVGGDSCVFEDCVFTLAEEDISKAATVLFPDAEKMMAMDGTTRPIPRVEFKRCLIRGKGHGVWVKASRAVEIAATQTLTVIDGPLFLSEPGGRATPGTRSLLELSRVTAFVGGPLVELRGGKVGEMRVVPLDVHADECLFAAVPGAGRPLVELDGVDPDEVMKVVPWQVKSANRYANFDDSATVMLARPSAEGTTPKVWNWDQWVTFASEPAAGAGKRVGKVTFENAPATLAALAAIRPADVIAKSLLFGDLEGNKPLDVGAAPDKLPVPISPE